MQEYFFVKNLNFSLVLSTLFPVFLSILPLQCSLQVCNDYHNLWGGGGKAFVAGPLKQEIFFGSLSIFIHFKCMMFL